MTENFNIIIGPLVIPSHSMKRMEQNLFDRTTKHSFGLKYFEEDKWIIMEFEPNSYYIDKLIECTGERIVINLFDHIMEGIIERLPNRETNCVFIIAIYPNTLIHV